MEEKELKYDLSTVIPIDLYNYIGNLGNEHFIINHKFFIQNAYNYCIGLGKEELKVKMDAIVPKCYNLFLVRRNTKSVNLKLVEPLKEYYATNLIVLYIMIYLEDNKDIFGITEENKFNA